MRRVCVDARMAFHSGIGTYIRNILPFLKNHYSSLWVLTSSSVIEKWPEIKTYNLIVTSAAPYSVMEQLELPLRIPSCDLFWSPHYNIPVLPIRAARRVVTIHDVYHLAYGHTLGPLKHFYAKQMLNKAVKISDHVITVSQFSSHEIVKYTHVSPDKITVIHNGVDQAIVSPQVSGDYFLFVSTLLPHKNLNRLLQSWNKVIQKHVNYELVVVGKETKNCDYLKVFEEFPILKSKVRFLGQVDSDTLKRLYQQAYALISPSIYEGFGLPALESMSMGCPTIVSEIASYPEVCGDAALYVNPFDIQDIAQKISLLIDSPSLHQTLRKRGMERVTQFTWEKSAEKHIEIMEQL